MNDHAEALMARKTAPKPTLIDAAASGDRRAVLEAMRDQLARQMTEADTNVVAQIAARLQAVLKDLDELPNGDEVSFTDELAHRRSDRLAAANVEPPASRASQQRRPGGS